MMSDDLVLLTNSTSFHIVCDPLLHLQPLIMFLSFTKCFISAWMSSGWVVVYEVHDSSFDYVDRRYIDFCFQGCSGNFELLF